MPSDPRKWQACGYGLRDHDNRTAIPGCQSDRNYGDARKFVSYDKCVKYCRERIDAIVGDLSPGVQRLYARGKDDFAKRVWAIVMPVQCIQAEKMCIACLRTHCRDVLTSQHRVFALLEPPAATTHVSSQVVGSKRVLAAPIGAADSGDTKRLRSTEKAAAQAAEEAELEVVRRYLDKVELAASHRLRTTGRPLDLVLYSFTRRE